MKNFRRMVLGSFVAVILLAVGIVGYSQTQFTEVYDLLFRVQSPQVRHVGVLSHRDLAGTTAGQVAMARASIVTTAATLTLAATDCGAVIVSDATSGTQVFTLPAIGNVGCQFTFIAGNAGTEIQFKTPAVATCNVSFLPAGATPVINNVNDTSCEGGIKNTAATNVIGDSVTIISDGVRWLGVGLNNGIWAAV